MLGQGGGQAADCILIFLEHRSIIAQYLLFKVTQIIHLHRRWGAGQYIQDIHPSFGDAGQIVSLWRTTSVFIFALCVGFNASYFTKNLS